MTQTRHAVTREIGVNIVLVMTFKVFSENPRLAIHFSCYTLIYHELDLYYRASMRDVVSMPSYGGCLNT